MKMRLSRSFWAVSATIFSVLVVSDAFVPQTRLSGSSLASRSPLFYQQGDEDATNLASFFKDNGSSKSSSSSSSLTTSQLLLEFSRDLSRLSELRPPVPSADFSATHASSSAGSSYTKIWTQETWKKHSLTRPTRRYMKHLLRWPFTSTFRKVFPASLVAASWAALVSLFVRTSAATLGPGGTSASASMLKGASAALGVLAAPLALLLTLRTNASMGRLNETRVVWGRLAMYSRQMGALLRTYMLAEHPQAAILAARHVCIYGWLLKAFLRGEERDTTDQVMRAMLSPNDCQWLTSHPRPVWGITVRLRQIVQAVEEHAKQQQQNCNLQVPCYLLERSISDMEGVAGVCERTLGSPIPPTYTRHTSRVMVLWLTVLPLGLLGSGVPVIGTILATALMSYVMIGLDEIGLEFEDPFIMLPLQQLAAATQNGVAMQLMDHDGSLNSSGNGIEKVEMPSVPLN